MVVSPQTGPGRARRSPSVARLRSSGEPDDAGPPSWDDAPAPAQVAKRVLEGVFRREVPAERIGFLATLTHWSYGTLWGAWYGLVQESARAPAPAHGALFGAGVWGTSYLTLVPMGI